MFERPVLDTVYYAIFEVLTAVLLTEAFLSVQLDFFLRQVFINGICFRHQIKSPALLALTEIAAIRH
jgi:hypothetical protein